MSTILQSLLTFILLYKYVGIFLVLFVGSFAIFIPSGAIMLASFFFATQGFLNLPAAAAAGLLGCVAGDNAVYWLSRRYGEPFLAKIGLARFLRTGAYRALETKMTARPVLTVVFTRFATTLTPFANVVTGMAKLRYRTFFIAALVGQAGDVALNCLYAWLFGSNWENLTQVTMKFPLIIIAVALIALMWWSSSSRRQSFS